MANLYLAKDNIDTFYQCLFCARHGPCLRTFISQDCFVFDESVIVNNPSYHSFIDYVIEKKSAERANYEFVGGSYK